MFLSCPSLSSCSAPSFSLRDARDVRDAQELPNGQNETESKHGKGFVSDETERGRREDDPKKIRVRAWVQTHTGPCVFMRLYWRSSWHDVAIFLSLSCSCAGACLLDLRGGEKKRREEKKEGSS